MNTLSGSTLSDYHIPATGGYDGVGNRLSVTASLPGAPASYSGTTHYAYNYGQTQSPQMNRSQLTGETSTRTSGTFSYGYDGGTSTGPGNPTSFKGSTNTFNADNQVTNTGYGYDGNGSPTRYKNAALTFDPEQRMTGYNGSTQTDGYDGDGLRTWKQTGGVKTYFLYDAGQPVCEYLSASVCTNTFGADGLVSRHSVGGSSVATTFYTFDERGDVSERVNMTTTGGGPVRPHGPGLSGTSGTLSAVSEVYDAFGSRTAQSPQPDPFGYGGQAGYYTDAETGLILCTHRFYDPSSGRWLTRDPISYRGGINLYGYCQNNPVGRIDPTGYAQLITVYGGISTVTGIPSHQYLETNCGGSLPTQSFGFYPNPTAPAGGFFGGGSAINGVSGGVNVYSGKNNGPGGTGDPDEGSGGITDWNGNSAFGQALCKCIAQSQASNPSYNVALGPDDIGHNYVCYTWAQDMWDCANGGAPSYFQILTGIGLSGLSNLAPL